MISGILAQAGDRIKRVVDAEDRELLGRALVWVTTLSFGTVLVAGVLGLAFRVFGLAAG